MIFINENVKTFSEKIMKNTDNTKTIPYYCSWIALIVFVLLLIFQPSKMTFYALRPSDGWLIICLFFQYLNGYYVILPFRNRFLVKNYGLFIGTIAIIATIIQASYANISLDSSFVFNFYRFFRFLLIFKFVENIISGFTSNDVKKFWNVYTFLGIIVIILSFLEFYGIQPFKQIIMNLYYQRPDSELDDYLLQVDRLAGVMGNPNTTALLILTTLTYPLLKIGSKGIPFILRLVYFAYILAGVYVLLVMTGSRSSILTLFIILAFILIATLSRLKELLLVVMISMLLMVTGLHLYQRFKSGIIIQDRVTESFRGEKFQLSAKGIAVWSGRYELWQERFRTFKREGNQLAILLGIGYTKPDEDYADNGLISTLLNNGVIGLLLKLLLFYLFFTHGFLRAIHNYHKKKIDLSYLAVALCTFALLMWELTADLTDHYKLGQLFYLFLSIIMIINGKIFLTNSQ